MAVNTMSRVDEPVAGARRAWLTWRRTPAAERGAALRAAAAALRAGAAELARIHERDTGRPADEAGVATLEQYAELGSVHRGRSLLGAWSATDLMVPEPRGVVLALTPWNDPVAVACGLLGAALVTGNCVVHKPSERSPSVGVRLGELENGGNDPLLVDSSVDPAWAARQAAVGAFTNAGQLCVSVERIYVHRGIAGEFLAALTAEATAGRDNHDEGRARDRPGRL